MKRDTDRRFVGDVENTSTPKQNAAARAAIKTLQRKTGSSKGPGRPKK